MHSLLFLFLAKSEELPKKPLGQERPLLLLPLQPDSALEVKINLQPQSLPITEVQQTDSITLHQTPSPPKPQDISNTSRASTPSTAPPDPIVVHSQRTPSPIRPFRAPPLPPKAGKSSAKGDVNETRKDIGQQESQCSEPEIQVEHVDWPPPYEPPALDIFTMSEEEIGHLPDLPPPPFFYPDLNDQRPPDRVAPCLDTEAVSETQLFSPSPRSASPLVTQMKPPKPPASLNLAQKKPPFSRPSPPSASAPPYSSSSSPRLPPPKPTKFPVSLYVPVSTGDRRPSNTSQYDNLSEADEDDRYLERLLGSTPEEITRIHCNSPHTTDREYDPALYPLPPPLVFIPPSPSPIPHSVCTLPSLPQEPDYEGEDTWVEDSIIPPPPPSFADRLTPFQYSTVNCSDTHQSTSPSYSKPISRGPRDHSAFPAPLLYTGSPPGHSRPSGPAVGVPMVRSSPDFCRMPQDGQQLPKSVTF